MDRPEGQSFQLNPWLVLTAYLGVAVAVTWPTILTFNSRVIGPLGDNFGGLHLLWWTKAALFDYGVAPWTNELLAFPHARELTILPASPLLQLVGALLLAVGLPLVATFNALVLAGFVGTAFATFLLVRAITRSGVAGWIGGLVLGFSAPLVASNAFNLAFVGGLPLWLLAVHQWRQKQSLATGLALVGSFFVLSLSNAYYFLLLGLVPFAVFTGVLVAERPTRQRLLAWLGWHGLAVAVSLGVYLVPYLAASSETRELLTAVGTTGATQYTTEVMGYLLPAPANPFLSWFTRPAALLFPLGSVPREGSVYLGITALALAWLGWQRAEPETRRWYGWLGLIAFVLSLGPFLRIFATITTLPLPYRFLMELPGFEALRSPGRLVFVVLACVVVFVGLGIARLWASSPLRWRGLFLGLVTVILLGEQLTIWPFPSQDAAVPGWYRSMPEGPEAALELPPWGFNEYRYAYFQTVHGHPLVNNTIARAGSTSLRTLQLTPGVTALYQPEHLTDTADGRPSVLRGYRIRDNDLLPASSGFESLRAVGVRWIVLHRALALAPHDDRVLIRSVVAEYERYLTSVLGSPIQSDEELVVYDLAAATGLEERLRLVVGDGWPLRIDGYLDERAVRTIGLDQLATLSVAGPAPAVQRLRLEGALGGRTIAVSYRGSPVPLSVESSGSATDHFQTATTAPLMLTPGETITLRATANADCLVPDDAPLLSCTMLPLTRIELVDH